MSDNRRRVLPAASAAVTVLACGALAADAGAVPTVVTQPCVRDIGAERTMAISGSGFAPGSSIRLAYTSNSKPAPQFLSSADADAAGNFATLSPPASFNSFKTTLQSFTLIAADYANPALAAATPFQQVKAGYFLSPDPKRPRSKTHHIARGLVPGQTVYLHLRYHRKLRRTVKIGVAQGPCGIASRKMKALPTKVRLGIWKYYVDQSKSFSLKTLPQFRRAFRIFRTFL